MDMRVIAVREKANAVLKVKHYGNEEKAAYTKTGKEELLDYMILNLKRKDDIAKELDEKFGGK